MATIQIGTTGLTAEQTGFGALPIQRIPKADAVRLLSRALDGGMTYFDTARAYSDSEEKLGAAFGGRWSDLTVATKTMARDADGFWSDLHTSLKTLGTDHIDIYQFHMPPFCPKPGGEDGLYDAALQAQAAGKIRLIGITCHRMDVAREAVSSGLYSTLMYPFSYLRTAEELALMQRCVDAGMGFIAMKALSGGLLTHSAAACAFLLKYPVLPIWGIQRETELDEFLSYIKTPPTLTPDLQAIIDADRSALQGDFCRGCGYCMPCPQGIQISTAARASLMLRRAPSQMLLDEAGQALMKKVEDCVSCGQCAARCPYSLDTPALLKKNYQDYQEVLAGKPL